MYYEDLSPYKYCLPFELKEVKNVGWLDALHQYDHGDVGQDCLNRIEKIFWTDGIVNVHVNLTRGVHRCDFCEKDQITWHSDDKQMLLGCDEIWIPSTVRGLLYASPSLLVHYIRDHGYLPPQEFVNSVLSMKLDAHFIAEDVCADLISRAGN